MKVNTPSCFIVYVALLYFSAGSWADGLAVDKVYLPYVNPLEKELEYRLLAFEEAQQDLQKHFLSYGQSINERLAAEVYLVFDKREGGATELELYELELRYQLSEQGEYAADWGLIAEIEKSHLNEIWEAAFGLISSRDWRRWTGTLNAFIEYEWGGDIVSEIELAARGQALYRYRETFEPGVELHLGQDTAAAGPIVKGLIRQGGGKKWLWEFGILAGLESATPDVIVKANIEFEFN